MTPKELGKIEGKLTVGKPLEDDEIASLFEYIDDLENLLDEADAENFYHTEGWRYILGISE